MPPKKRVVVSGERVRFDWELIDDIYVPVIFRDGTKFLSVRIVELKLLVRFPKVIPEDLRAIRKCVSLFITEKEASVLNEINLSLCKGEYGKERFTTNDVIVELDEFRDFFDLVNDTIICKNAIDMGFTEGGWLQINNTICPYVWVNNVRHLPHEVVCLAAELVDEDDPILRTTVTEDQLAILNGLCNSTSRSFSFDESTKLVSLLTLKLEVDPVVIELPADKPFDHATYVDAMLDKQSIYQLKARAKQLMNAYYNAAIIQKFAKEADEKNNLSALAALADATIKSKTKPPVSSASTKPASKSSSAPTKPTSKSSSVPAKPASKSPVVPAKPASKSPAVPTKPASKSSAVPTKPASKSPAVPAKPASNSPSVSTKDAIKAKLASTKPSKPAPTKTVGTASEGCPSRPLSAASTITLPDLDNSPTSVTLPESESRPSSTASIQSADSLNPSGTARRSNVSRSQKSTKVTARPTSAAASRRRSSGSSSTCQSPPPLAMGESKCVNMTDRYRLPPHHYTMVDATLMQTVAFWGPQMLPFSKSLPLGTSVDVAVLGLIAKCVRIATNVKFLFRKTLEILRDPTSQTNSTNKEALIVITDAVTNFKFWNASAHQVSVAGADLINTTLVKAALEDHPYSFHKSPDIIHYIVAGVFGARTQSGAANFKFLQELMTIGCVAAGHTEYSPFVSYDFARQRFLDLSQMLTRWSTVVSIQPLQISDAQFVRTTYQLFDKVYSTAALSTSPIPNFIQNTSEPPPYDQVVPSTAQYVNSQSIQQAQCSVTSSVVVAAPHIQKLLQSTVSSQLQQPSSTFSMAPKMTTSVKPALGQPVGRPVTQPLQAYQPSVQQAISSAPSIAVNQMNQNNLLFSQPVRLPALQVASTPQPMPPLISSKAETKKVADSSKSIYGFPIANPVHIKHNAVNSRPAETVPQPEPEASIDYSDFITLSRAHGKKIPCYKNGTEEWLLVEDVQKTYFPRMELGDFVKKIDVMRITTWKVGKEVGQAFRQYYSMTQSEEFELNKMMLFSSLAKVIAMLKGSPA